MSQDHSSRLQQPDGCQWGWTLFGDELLGANPTCLTRQDESILLVLRGVVLW